MTDEAKQQLVTAVRREERQQIATALQVASRGFFDETAKTATILWNVSEWLEEMNASK